MQNCVDIANNRTQYLVVVTLLPLEMGNGFEFRPVRRTTREKIVQEEFHASKEKGSEKEKETLIASEEVFSPTEVLWPLERSTSRGVFCCPLESYGCAKETFRKIWVVPEAGWW
jgi:hypothetical protein